MAGCDACARGETHTGDPWRGGTATPDARGGGSPTYTRGEHIDQLPDTYDMNVQTAQTRAHRLRDRRHACGLTQADLAERSGVPLHELVAMEQGLTRTPYFTSVALLAQVLGVESHWLYHGESGAQTTP